MLWRPHHLIQARPNFDFLGKRKIAMVLSTVINVASLVGVLIFGLNFGIDFESCTRITTPTSSDFSLTSVPGG